MRCSELLRASRWLLRTIAAFAHPAPATFPQPARRAPQSLSLGSLGSRFAMHVWKSLAQSTIAVILSGCSTFLETGRITYEDRNGDGIIDREYHAFAGADRNWELIDEDFDGRYDKKISYGFARKETRISKRVPPRA